MTTDGWSTKWLFRMLDYEHYTVSCDGHIVAYMVINHADRDVWVRAYDDVSPDYANALKMPYARARRWLRSHEQDLLP